MASCAVNGVGRKGRPNGASLSNTYRSAVPSRRQYGSVTRASAGTLTVFSHVTIAPEAGTSERMLAGWPRPQSPSRAGPSASRPGPTIGDQQPDFHGLPWRHDPIVGQRLDPKTVGQTSSAWRNKALRALQPGVDLEPGDLAQPERRKLGAQVLRRQMPSRQRGVHRGVAWRSQRGIGGVDCVGNLPQTIDQPWTAASARQTCARPGSDRSRPSSRSASSLSGLSGNRRVRELILHRKRARQREQLAEALALVHRARFAADFGVGASEQGVVDIGFDRDQPGAFRRLGLAPEKP